MAAPCLRTHTHTYTHTFTHTQMVGGRVKAADGGGRNKRGGGGSGGGECHTLFHPSEK